MTNSETKPEPAGRRDEPPPVLGTWRRVYFTVIAWLIFLIAIFYLFARRFAP